jgi:serine kinase of HPr protein (carbohydrate metabolism regulator)
MENGLDGDLEVERMYRLYEQADDIYNRLVEIRTGKTSVNAGTTVARCRKLRNASCHVATRRWRRYKNYRKTRFEHYRAWYEQLSPEEKVEADLARKAEKDMEIASIAAHLKETSPSFYQKRAAEIGERYWIEEAEDYYWDSFMNCWSLDWIAAHPPQLHAESR